MTYLEKKKQYKNASYLKNVRTNSCLICNQHGSDAHHMRGVQSRGMGMKASGDEYAVPLCRNHHTECHTHGDERIWWDMQGIDSIGWAEKNFKAWSMDRGEK